ncbi:MAG: Mov34/MPN/PAD-1 family protein [archaeon]
MYKIALEAMRAIMEAAKSTWPNEFIALLEVENSKICGLVMLPSVYGNAFSSLRMDLLPMTTKVNGSVHSHPNYSNRPSAGDLIAFPKLGKVNLIICRPFSAQSLKAYDSKGNELELEVVA